MSRVLSTTDYTADLVPSKSLAASVAVPPFPNSHDAIPTYGKDISGSIQNAFGLCEHQEASRGMEVMEAGPKFRQNPFLHLAKSFRIWINTSSAKATEKKFLSQNILFLTSFSGSLCRCL